MHAVSSRWRDLLEMFCWVQASRGSHRKVEFNSLAYQLKALNSVRTKLNLPRSQNAMSLIKILFALSFFQKFPILNQTSSTLQSSMMKTQDIGCLMILRGGSAIQETPELMYCWVIQALAKVS